MTIVRTSWLTKKTGGWYRASSPWLCEPYLSDWFDVDGAREIRMVFTDEPTEDAYCAHAHYGVNGHYFRIGASKVCVYSWLAGLVYDIKPVGGKFWFWVEVRK